MAELVNAKGVVDETKINIAALNDNMKLLSRETKKRVKMYGLTTM